MAARVASQHMAEAEQAGRRLSHGLARHLSIGIGSVTARIESLLAEPEAGIRTKGIVDGDTTVREIVVQLLHELAFRPDAVEHLKQQRTQ